MSISKCNLYVICGCCACILPKDQNYFCSAALFVGLFDTITVMTRTECQCGSLRSYHVQGRQFTLRKDDLQRELSIIAQQKAFANGGSQLEKVSLFIPSSFLGNCCRRRPGLDLLNVLTFDRPHIGHFDSGLQSVLMEPLYCAGMRVKSRNL